MSLPATTILEYYTQIGLKQGYEIGFKQGYKIGFKQGYEIGLIEGEISGIQKVFALGLISQEVYDSMIKPAEKKLEETIQRLG